jgi:preprotein translocase subunit SecD
MVLLNRGKRVFSGFVFAGVLVTLMAVSGTAQGQRRYSWYLVLEVNVPPATLKTTVGETISRLDRRLRALGLSSFKIEPQAGDGSKRIVVQLPAVAEPERLKHLLVSEAQLEFRAVMSPPEPGLKTYASETEAQTAAATTTGEVFPYRLSDIELQELKLNSRDRFILVEKLPLVSGSDIRSAEARTLSDYDVHYSIYFDLRSEAAERMRKWSGMNIKNYLAIVYNRKIASVVFIQSEIDRSGVIEGKFSRAEAEDLAAMINSGPLPAPVKIVAEGNYNSRVAQNIQHVEYRP